MPPEVLRDEFHGGRPIYHTPPLGALRQMDSSPHPAPSPHPEATTGPAGPADVAALHQMRRKTERWLAERNIQQWGQGFVTREDIAAQVADQQWFVTRTRNGGSIVAALRYLASDPDVWTHEPVPARYVHGLMVDRDTAPPGAGAAILRWAENRAASEGITLMRLDCVETNHTLRGFYRRQGYHEVARRDFDGPWFSATLLEKPLP